jgi:hypothetical protein
LATLSSDHADERIQVVLDRGPSGVSTISLVQQSWSESLGWYTQQVMNLTPEQVVQLRSALGMSSAGKVPRVPADEPLAIGPVRVSVPFPSPTRRAHSA